MKAAKALEVVKPAVPPNVLLTVTNWWPCASRLAMGLTQMGCAVSAVYPASGHSLSKTRAIQQRFRYSPFDPVSSLRTAIEAVEPDIVIPCDDRAVRHLHELHARDAGQPSNRSKIRMLIEASLGPPESYPVVSSRYDLLKIAREEGIRIPDTRQVCSASQLNCGNIDFQLPWVLKADGSWGGHGVRIAHNPKEAAQSFSELSRPLPTTRLIKRMLVDRDPYWLDTWFNRTKPRVVVQSYIQGRPANSAVVCWKGKVLAGIAVEVANAQGATGSATIVRVVDNPEMLLPAGRLARRLGLSGFFGFDFMIENGTGDAFLIEMNPRCTPLSHLQLGNGSDLIAALAAELSNTPLRERTAVTESNMIAYFPQAWHWDRESRLLQSSFHDVPVEEPDLVQDLLRLPWPDRGALARITSALRGTTFTHRAQRGGIFDFGAPARKPPQTQGKSSERYAREGHPAGSSPIVPFRTKGTKPPLLLIHGVDGTLDRFRELVRNLEPDRPVYGVLSQALLGEAAAVTSVEELAAYYIQAIQAVRTHGPYHVLGFSFGGLVAFEMARQLRDDGELVGVLGMLDNLQMGAHARQARKRSGMARVSRLISVHGLLYAKEKVVTRGIKAIYTILHHLRRPIPRFLQRPDDINWFAALHYAPPFYPGRVTLFQAHSSMNAVGENSDLWARVAGGGVELHSIPGSHSDVLTEPNVISLAELLTHCLATSDAALRDENVKIADAG
jgi:thioesterase domain-containing protein